MRERAACSDFCELSQKSRKRVLYSSIVRYCDELRKRHSLEDRRPPLDNPMFRHRTPICCPFPWHARSIGKRRWRRLAMKRPSRSTISSKKAALTLTSFCLSRHGASRVPASIRFLGETRDKAS